MLAEAGIVCPPRHLWVPEHTGSAGGEAADLAAEVGLVLDPEQRMVLDAVLAEGLDGRWTALEVALICARQNLKSFVCETLVLADLYLFGSELVVWTAHEFNTAMEAFRHFKELIESAPFLSRRVRRITEANGEEGIELHSGQRLRFKARTKTGGRGLTGDRVILDEAFALTPSQLGSLMPTLSARPNPQLVYASSAGLFGSDVLRSVRDRGRAGGDPGLVYIEWTADQDCEMPGCRHHLGTQGCAADNPERWAQANPALDRRITRGFVEAERRSLPPAEFVRERLCWWDDPLASAQGIPDELWSPLRDRASTIESVKAFAVDVTPDQSWASLAVAGERADGVSHVELVRHDRGSRWVSEWFDQRRAEYPGVGVMLDATGPAGHMVNELETAGRLVTKVSARDMAGACGLFFDALLRQSLRHLGQPELDAAVQASARRSLGDSWAWSRRAATGDISPLVAVTLAHWAAPTSAPEPCFAYT